MTKIELLEYYLKPTDLTVKELIDRNAFAQIMQFVEAFHLEQLRNVVGQSERLCQHEWIDARNEVIKSGYVCLKCNSVKV